MKAIELAKRFADALDAMTDEEIVEKFAEMGCPVEIVKEIPVENQRLTEKMHFCENLVLHSGKIC